MSDMLMATLRDIDSKLINKVPLTAVDFDHIKEALRSPYFDIFSQATLLIPDLDHPKLRHIVDIFWEVDATRKAVMVTQLASTDYHYTYDCLFDALEHYIYEHPRLCELIVICLSKCEYSIIASLFRALSKYPKGEYFDQLKRIMLKRGFFYFKPFLKIYPEIPHEIVFRDVFGNEMLDRFKAKYGTTS